MPNKGREKNWTKAEKNTLKKYWNRLTAKDLTKILNKSVWAIYAQTKKMFPSNRKPVEAKKLTVAQNVPGKIKRVASINKQPIPVLKTCGKCGMSLPLDKYHKHIRAKDGHNSICKECRKAEHTSASYKNFTGNSTATPKPSLVIKNQPFVSQKSDKKDVPLLSLREMQFITGRIADLLPTQYLHFDKEKRAELHKALRTVYKFCGDLEPERIIEFMKG